MAYEILVGLQVDDPETYRRYRAEIKPLLERAGAGFRYDFEVGRTLLSGAEHEINRVFILSFPDAETRTRFFADPEYLAIRSRFFEAAVSGATVLAEYSR